MAISNDQDKALAYYKAAMQHEAPPWVPCRVRLMRDVFGDVPFRGAGAAAGEHACESNRWGAISVRDRSGQLLGIKPAEFEPLAWRKNGQPENGTTASSGTDETREPEERFHEPWTLGTDAMNGDELPIYADGAGGACMAAAWPLGDDFNVVFPGPRQTDVAKRIVACVNACAGLTTAQLASVDLATTFDRIESFIAGFEDDGIQDDTFEQMLDDVRGLLPKTGAVVDAETTPAPSAPGPTLR